MLAIWAVRFRADREQPLIPAVLAFVIVCLQGAFGALTVTLLLKPLIVTAHLLGGLTTLGIVVVAVACRQGRGSSPNGKLRSENSPSPVLPC